MDLAEWYAWQDKLETKKPKPWYLIFIAFFWAVLLITALWYRGFI